MGAYLGACGGCFIIFNLKKNNGLHLFFVPLIAPVTSISYASLAPFSFSLWDKFVTQSPKD
jgi:hypothetical protein